MPKRLIFQLYPGDWSRPCEHCGGRGSIPTPKALRRTREARLLSLGDVSRAVGVSVSYLSEVERGSRNITPFILNVYRGRLGATQKGVR